MDTTVRVLMPSEIPMLHEEIDLSSIENELDAYITEILPRINIQELDGWALLISIVSRSTTGIGVFKRIKRYPTDKEFEISISIPIPDNDMATYGYQRVKEGFYSPLDDKKFYTLEPDFEKYNSLYEYIFESSKRAIELAFQHGFVCNGKKIKFQSA